MKAWLWLSFLASVVACGGTFSDTSGHKSNPSADAGNASGGASAGGASSSGGSTSAGGAGTGGLVGVGGNSAGGATAAGGVGGAAGSGGVLGGAGGLATAGSAGTGGGINCSNVGCGAPPFCDQGCTAPCGCCPCADGQSGPQGYVCSAGCYELVSDGGGPTCTYAGRTYHPGESFRAGDGCNTCTCVTISPDCTLNTCKCDPASETHQRNYVATDPAQCAVIDFACPANTTYFANPCGCGCEQGLGCPDWFDCMPGPGQSCDTNQIKTQCPYSGIAF